MSLTRSLERHSPCSQCWPSCAHLFDSKLGQLRLITGPLYSAFYIPVRHAMPHQHDLLVARERQLLRRDERAGAPLRAKPTSGHDVRERRCNLNELWSRRLCSSVCKHPAEGPAYLPTPRLCAPPRTLRWLDTQGRTKLSCAHLQKTCWPACACARAAKRPGCRVV